MQLIKLYRNIVEIGIKNDPRPHSVVKAYLGSVKKEYDKLSAKEKELFDKERLVNPYADTRVLHGKDSAEIKTIFIGVDMETPELLLADRLNEKGQNIDLVVSHHPRGAALANFYEVMRMQSDIFYKFGVPITVAEGLTDERMMEVKRSVSASNHMRSVDAAKLLDIPFMCAHTVADNCVTTYLQNIFDKEKPGTAQEALDIVRDIPEYKDASKKNAGPTLLLGKDTGSAGRVFVDMTGGTEGSKEIFAKLSEAGVGTIICMHLSEQHYQKAKEAHINVIVAGHISSDTLGINILLDQLEKLGKFKIIPCSGFERMTHK